VQHFAVVAEPLGHLDVALRQKRSPSWRAGGSSSSAGAPLESGCQLVGLGAVGRAAGVG